MNIPDTIPCPQCRRRLSPLDVWPNIYRDGGVIDESVLLFVHSTKIHYDAWVASEMEIGARYKNPLIGESARERRRDEGYINALHGDPVPDDYCTVKKVSLMPLLAQILGVQAEMIAQGTHDAMNRQADAQRATAMAQYATADAIERQAMAQYATAKATRAVARATGGIGRAIDDAFGLFDAGPISRR